MDLFVWLLCAGYYLPKYIQVDHDGSSGKLLLLYKGGYNLFWSSLELMGETGDWLALATTQGVGDSLFVVDPECF